VSIDEEEADRFGLPTREDLKIVFWRTRWTHPKHQYMTAMELDEFKSLPTELREKAPDLADIAQQVIDADVDKIFQMMIDEHKGKKSPKRIN
jgi:hypothetical protein